jgi:hypothetical protein
LKTRKLLISQFPKTPRTPRTTLVWYTLVHHHGNFEVDHGVWALYRGGLMANRFEWHVIANAVEVISLIDGKEHVIRGGGKWTFRLKGPLEPSDLLRPCDLVIYREVVSGVMEFRVPAQIMATLLCGAKLTSVAEALARGEEGPLEELRSSLAGYIKVPRALLAEVVWSGSWRTGPGVQREKLGLKTDTLLTRIGLEVSSIHRKHEQDGLTRSDGKIDPMIAAVPTDIVEPMYSGSGEIISPSLVDRRSYEDSVAQCYGVDWQAVDRKTHFGRSGFLLRASSAGVDYRADPAAWQAVYRQSDELAPAIRRNRRRIKAPQITVLSDGVFAEHLGGGTCFTHWANRDLEF